MDLLHWSNVLLLETISLRLQVNKAHKSDEEFRHGICNRKLSDWAYYFRDMISFGVTYGCQAGVLIRMTVM